MARTTRSTMTHADKLEDENENPASMSPPATKAKTVTKKRKRGAGGDSDDCSSAKQTKTVDEENIEKAEEGQTQESEYLPLAGGLPMTDEDAQKILEILDMADTQGLLDRVFPLDDVLYAKPSSIPSSSKTPSDSYSLRTLLKEAKDHPLRVFRSAIKQLYPISSQPRARISPPAAQQQRFCQLALSLIEQASRYNIDGLSLKHELILSERSAEDEEGPESTGERRKYALVQRLPTGDLWTSLNTDLVSDAKPLSELSTGHAEVVAIYPSSSSSQKVPTLGELHADKKLQTKYKPTTTRHISCGSFLDYGPYASFAPAFDSNGGDIGRMGVTNTLWRRHEKGKAREKARILGDRLRQKLAAQAAEDMEADDVVEIEPSDVKTSALHDETEKRKELVEKLFVQEDAEAMQRVLCALDCEESISELLLHNAKALIRLQEMQKARLRGEGGNTTEVTVGSDEWNLAQTIMNNLTLFVSMRPRKSNGTSSAILPPDSVLRIIQQTLPSEPTQGWYGTLQESCGFAVRDDTTVRMKTSLEAQPTAAVTIPAAIPAAAVPQIPASTYQSNYSYAGFSQHYRTAPTLPYTPQSQVQAGTYFAQSASTPQAQKAQTPFQSQYGSSSQYTYGSWFPNQTAVAGSNAGTPTPASRRGTPQPTTVASGSFTNSSYLPYVSALAATTATPQRAVANTIATKPAMNGWSTAAAGASLGMPTPAAGGYTLTPHLRPAGGVAPASPLTSGPPFGLATHLAGYQATPPAANT